MQFNALRSAQDATNQLAREGSEIVRGIGLVRKVVAVDDGQCTLTWQQSAEHIWSRGQSAHSTRAVLRTQLTEKFRS